uniref:CASP-like protein n=1 Tax=Manihot esculenta TaxID=3983 RepID=A0A2C9UCJ9_MANES
MHFCSWLNCGHGHHVHLLQFHCFLVTATLSLAAASASAGITVLLFQDVEHCSYLKECEKYQISVALAFLSWGAIAISSLIMLWLLAAG